MSEIVTLKMYGDESSDEKQENVFTVAGVVGSEEEWAAAEEEWTVHTGGKPFHAAECEAEFAREKDRAKHQANLRMYASLTQVLVASQLVGFAYSLDLRSRAKFLPDVLPDMAYYKCLTDLISTASNTSRRFNALPTEEIDIRFEFSFDSRDESDGTAKTIYRIFRSQPEWLDTGILGTDIDFRDTFDPRLDMADLFAREAMKELNRKLTGVPAKPRQSYLALESANKDGVKQFRFIERDRDFCQRWAASLEEPENKAFMSAYGKWLSAKHQHDSMTNRFLFFATQ